MYPIARLVIVFLLLVFLTVPLRAEAPSEHDERPLPSVSTDPRDRARVYYERARVLEEWGLWEKALAHYELVLMDTQDPSHVRASHFGMASCYYRLGRYEESLEALDRIQPDESEHPHLTQRVGQARERVLEALSEGSPGN